MRSRSMVVECDAVRAESGLITSHRFYFDTMNLLSQHGVTRCLHRVATPVCPRAEPSGGRNDLRVGLCWCHVAEGLPWPGVEAALDAPEAGGRVLREVDPFGKYWLNSPLGVPVRMALQGAQWEVDPGVVEVQ